MVTLLAATALTVIILPARAQTFVWTAAGGTDWMTGSNWYDDLAAAPGATPPGAANPVLIDNGPIGPRLTQPGASSGELRVGASAEGWLTIAAGGALDSTWGRLGLQPGSTGSVGVIGTGAAWTVDSLSIGESGTGHLSIMDGGTVTVTAGIGGVQTVAGTSYSGEGTIHVSGAGSSFSTEEIVLGFGGRGELTVDDGAEVRSTSATLGMNTGTTGYATISGEGSLWVIQNDLMLGAQPIGRGEVTISDGGVLGVLGVIRLASDNGGAGVINIGAAAGDAAAAPGTVDAGFVLFDVGLASLVFNHTGTDYEFSASLNSSVQGVPGGETGNIEHYAGVTSLAGNAGTFNGPTTIHGGTLRVQHTLGGVIAVNGGALGGIGTLTGPITVSAGGAIAPGNSIGVLNVGDILFQPGSILEVEVNNAGQSDLLNASGQVVLHGGAVRVLAENGTDNGSTYADGSRYTIVSAHNIVDGVIGAFDPTVIENFAFLAASLEYDANQIELVLTRVTPPPGTPGTPGTPIGFCLAEASVNQCATGVAVEALAAGNPLYDQALGMTVEQALAAFSALSGEIHASIPTALIEDSRMIAEAALDRTRSAFTTQSVLSAVDDGTELTLTSPSSVAFWAKAFGAQGSWSGNGNVAAFDRSTGGLLFGGDGLLTENFQLGLMGGYSRSGFGAGGLGSGTADTYQLGAYGSTQLGGAEMRFGGAYGWHRINTTRTVTVGGLSNTLTADYGAATGQAFGELAYPFLLGDARFEPFANLTHVNFSHGGFSETGGPAALSVASAVVNATFTTLGLRGEVEVSAGETPVSLNGAVGWRHAFGDAPNASMAFASGGGSFAIAGAALPRDVLVVEAGLDLTLSPSAVIGVSYDGQFGSGLANQSLSADLSVKF